MDWFFTPYSFILFITAAISTALAIYAWQQRDMAGARGVVWMMLGVAEWTLSYGLEIASVNLPARIFWAQMQYIGAGVVPLAWLLFALEYAGKTRWFTRRNYALALGIPTLTVLFAFTNDAHHLIWRQVGISERVVGLDIASGVWFWINVYYAYGIIFLATFILLQKMIQSPPLYRRQVAALVGGALIPWVANALDMLGVNWLLINLTAPSFMLTGILFAWGIFRYRLLDIVPLARDAVIESMGDGMIVLDRQDRIVDLNPAAQRTFRVTDAQAIGKPMEMVWTEWRDWVRRHNGETEQSTEIVPDLVGEPRSYAVRISPLKDRKGVVSGRLLVLRDTTERERAEGELKKAKDAAEAASRAKSTFLANTSHELRTPLNAIIGYSEMLEEQVIADGADQYAPDLAKITAAGKRLLALINEILDLSKIEAGRMQLHAETFPLAPLIREVLDTLIPLAEKNGVRWAFHLPAELGEMHSDEAKVRQALFNLLSNACKFTPHGTVTLAIERATVSNTGWLTFRVSDTGIGISPEQLETLFQPFIQADTVLTRRFGGTGLGLAITRHFCDLLGGTITVASTLGAGSTFTMRLPAELPVIDPRD